MRRLLRIQLLRILDPEPEEITQLGRSVNLRLPGILTLTVHGQRHNLVAVLARNQVRSLEEDTGTIGERGGRPGLPRGKRCVDGRFDIGSRGVRV